MRLVAMPSYWGAATASPHPLFRAFFPVFFQHAR